MHQSKNYANMKFFILIALLAPAASIFDNTVKYVYKKTVNCGGYNSTLMIKNCHEGDFCMSPIYQDIKGSLVLKFGEVIKEPLFFTYSAVRYDRGMYRSRILAINGSTFLCSLIECPVKPGIEYRLPLEIPFNRYEHSKDVVRVTAVIDNKMGDVEVCASRDIIKFK